MSTLAFDLAGTGRPLVFLHGWCCNRRHMRGLARHFAKTHQVYSVDLPGHGETPLENRPPTFDAFAEAIGQFMDQQDLRDAVLVGHSMGGALSIFTAGIRPGRIAGVVNLDGALPLRETAREGYRKLFSAIEAQGFHNLFPAFARQAFFLPEELGETAEGLIAEMLAAPEALAVALLGQFPTLDASRALLAAQVPLLYIGGSTPRFEEAGVARLRPDAWIARVALRGHFLPIFAQAQIIPMIERFLERYPKRTVA